MAIQRSLLLVGCTLLLTLSTVCAQQEEKASAKKAVADHVLLISVDGLHHSDLTYYIKNYPKSNLAKLANRGIVYNQATSSRPSDSFPGLAALVTGGNFKSHGLLYDNSYDFALFDPTDKNCTKKGGANALYDESIEFDDSKVNGGGGIDPAKLPRALVKGKCVPVYPNQRVRVNTIFEVAVAAKRTTAWSDKHFAYQWLQGKSGKGVTDLYNIEITGVANSAKDPAVTITYDNLKTPFVLNWIKGLDATGTRKLASVPAIMGLNYQSTSVAQKTQPNGGYRTPLPTAIPDAILLRSLKFFDDTLGKFEAEIEKQNLTSRFAIVVSAKHGQSPVGFNATKIDDGFVNDAVTAAVASEPAFVTADDIALIYLKDIKNTAAVVKALATKANMQKLGIQRIMYGGELANEFGSPREDTRVPHIILIVKPGVIYTTSKTKTAEHGGFGATDNRVGLLVAAPGVKGAVNNQAVRTQQVAPTILSLLGLNPNSLEAVKREKIQLLPGF